MKFRSLLARRHGTEEIDESGFTLIELLIVVVIMGILAAVVAFAVGSFASTSAVAACNTDAKSVQTAVSAFYAQEGKYPTATTDLVGSTSAAEGGPYLHSWPSNTSYTVGLGTATTPAPAAGEVDVALAKTDPGYNDVATTFGTAGSAVNYDTVTGVWISGASEPATSNICSGA